MFVYVPKPYEAWLIICMVFFTLLREGPFVLRIKKSSMTRFSGHDAVYFYAAVVDCRPLFSRFNQVQ